MRDKLHRIIDDADWFVYDEDDTELSKILDDLAKEKDEEDDLDG